MTRIAPDWLTAPATRTALAALAPGKPLFVGGCVRDALMARKTEDIDIAVTTPPEETLRLAEAAGLGAHPTGLDHGVVTITVDGAPFEVATLRRDVATDGRRAVVAYTDDVAEDAARRDFTMNALYADAEGAVIDPLDQGLEDLAARRIRFIGEPDRRIAEDHLRILRFFRFHAQFDVDEWSGRDLAACRVAAPSLKAISKERIGAEMRKLLAAPDPEPALARMPDVLSVVLPEASAFKGLTTVERSLGLKPDWLRRLAALGAPPDRAAKRLRLSRAEATRLGDVERAVEADAHPAESAYRWGPEAARDAVAMKAMSGVAPPKDWRAAIDAGASAQLPVKPADLIALGAKPGPALGARLKELEVRWIASGFTATKGDLLGS